MVTTIHERRNIISGVQNLTDAWDTGRNNVHEIINITNPGADGKGAVRGIRIRNLEPSGWYVSGFQQLRMILDNRVVASGTMQVPYETDNGRYINLGQFVLGADYHESYYPFGSGVSWVSQQRVPFHRSFRLQARWIWRSGWHNGFTVDVWYELKG